MKTRQINVLKSPAEKIRQNNPPWQLAGIRCDFNPRNLLARNRRHFNSRYWLAREPPLPRSESPGKTRPAPPPPQQLRSTEEGEGQETDQARPCILNRYFYFHSLHMNDYIFLYGTMHMHSIQCGLMNESITIYFRRRNCLLGRGEEPISSRPIKRECFA
jgi:hypothetical protein